ncbi:MAG: hypothetical protein ACTSU5_10235 [Promethearchaeota archaeon]
MPNVSGGGSVPEWAGRAGRVFDRQFGVNSSGWREADSRPRGNPD